MKAKMRENEKPLEDSDSLKGLTFPCFLKINEFDVIRKHFENFRTYCSLCSSSPYGLHMDTKLQQQPRIDCFF